MYALPVDVDVQMIQKNKLFQKFMQQQQQEQSKQQQLINKPRNDSIDNQQKLSHDKLEESSIYQDFANFAKATNYKQASPYNIDKKIQNQALQQPSNYPNSKILQQNYFNYSPEIPSNNQELKELQNKNKSLLQQNSILQQQLIDIQQLVHRNAIDFEISKNELLNSKRVIQEQQIEIEQLKRQLQEKRNNSLDKTRQFSVVQTQLIQSNQMVEKLISQLMAQEQQLSMYRQTSIGFPKIDSMQYNVEQNKSNLMNAQNLLQNNSNLPQYQTQQTIQQQTQGIQQLQQQQISNGQQISQPQQPNPNPVSQPTKQQQLDPDTSYERYLMHKRGRY